MSERVRVRRGHAFACVRARLCAQVCFQEADDQPTQCLGLRVARMKADFVDQAIEAHPDLRQDSLNPLNPASQEINT